MFETSTSTLIEMDHLNENTISMFLDLMNQIKRGYFKDQYERQILKSDISPRRQDIFKFVSSFINHSVQLTDVKGLSWILNEKKIISIPLKVEKILFTYELSKEVDTSTFEGIDLFSKKFFDLDISVVTILTGLKMYFYQMTIKNEVDMKPLFDLIKLGYTLQLIQIAARIKYEKNGFYLTDFKSLAFDQLLSLIEK